MHSNQEYYRNEREWKNAAINSISLLFTVSHQSLLKNIKRWLCQEIGTVLSIQQTNTKENRQIVFFFL